MKNQAIVEHIIYESFGKGNLSKYELMIAHDVKVHCPSSWQEIFSPILHGRETVKKIDQELAKAFEFTNVVIADLIVGQDKIIARWGCDGMHNNDFFSVKVSHLPFQLSGQTIYQFNYENKVEQVWQSWDMLGLLKQIGSRTSSVPVHENKATENLMKKWLVLSEKERECIKYLVQGKTAKETAKHMHLSYRTVEYYFENIKNKVNCYKKRELFAFAGQLEKNKLI